MWIRKDKKRYVQIRVLDFDLIRNGLNGGDIHILGIDKNGGWFDQLEDDLQLTLIALVFLNRSQTEISWFVKVIVVEVECFYT